MGGKLGGQENCDTSAVAVKGLKLNPIVVVFELSLTAFLYSPDTSVQQMRPTSGIVQRCGSGPSNAVTDLVYR